MAIRFDIGDIRKVEITPEGFLRCEASFARDGILEYRDTVTGKIRKEFRSCEVNSNPAILNSYGSRPVTVEHPPILLDTKNAKDHAVGMTDSAVRYDPGQGLVRGSVVLFDSTAIELARTGQKGEVSAGYQCDLDTTPGEWNGERYDARQINVRVNHVCLTSKGRAGETVRLHLDSQEDLGELDVAIQVRPENAKAVGQSPLSDAPCENFDSLINSPKKMETTVIRIDNMDCPGIPIAVASIVNSKLKELETVAARLDSVAPQLDSLRTEVNEERENSDRHRGRADALEIELEETRYLLEQSRTDEAGHKCEKCSKKLEEDDEENEEESDLADEMGWEKAPKGKAKRSKKSTMDSADEDYIASEVAARIDAWADAEEIVPDILSSHFDSTLNATDIKKLVLSHFDSNVDLDGLSEAYIQGRFDSVVVARRQETDVRTDSAASNAYTNEMAIAISHSRAGGSRNPVQVAQSENRNRIANNWETPLSLSKRNRA